MIFPPILKMVPPIFLFKLLVIGLAQPAGFRIFLRDFPFDWRLGRSAGFFRAIFWEVAIFFLGDFPWEVAVGPMTLLQRAAQVRVQWE